MASGKYYRPEICITQEWFNKQKQYITKRDMGLLKLLYECRILKREQIQVLYPEFESICVLNRRLKRLYQLYVIDKYYFPSTGTGSSQQYICLDIVGMMLLDIDPKRYNKPIIETEKGKVLA